MKLSTLSQVALLTATFAVSGCGFLGSKKPEPNLTDPFPKGYDPDMEKGEVVDLSGIELEPKL